MGTIKHTKHLLLDKLLLDKLLLDIISLTNFSLTNTIFFTKTYKSL